jgi:aspartate aminotransferase
MIRISRRASSIMPSPTMWLQDIVSAMRSRGLKPYALHVGQPGIPPPRDLVENLLESLRSRVGDVLLYTYTSPRGFQELREAVAEDLASLGRPMPDPVRGVVITSGGIEGLFSVMASITDHGDLVRVVVPAYFHFYSVLGMLGNRVIEAISYPELSLSEDMWKDLFSRVRAVIVANPDNPTGRVLSTAEAKLLADLACDRKVYLVHDIAYYTLYYEAERVWPERQCYEYVITVGTYSKDPGIPGWRLGFVASQEEVANAVAHVREATSYNAPLPSQLLILEYLRGRYREKFLPRVLEEYRYRRDGLIESLEKHLPEARFRKPEAGIFLYVDLSRYLQKPSDQWTRELAIEKGVVTVPGTLFGPKGERWVRLSFAWESKERLKEAIEIISHHLITKTGPTS